MTSRQLGVTLLEVLISIVVLSIGLFGIGALQTVTLKNNTSAYQRGLATMLTYDVIDRIRADLPNRSDYVLALDEDGSGDPKDWKDGVKTALPGGNASVVIDLNDDVTVTIQWDDDRDGILDQLTTQTAL